MLELIMLYNGYNNGKIGLSIRDAATRCNIGKATAARAGVEAVNALTLQLDHSVGADHWPSAQARGVGVDGPAGAGWSRQLAGMRGAGYGR
jgi:hypothetical protein